MTVTITHSYAEGTLLDGTAKSDLPHIKPVMRAFKWKWSGWLGAWYQQSSRDQQPRMHRIRGTADKLRELGYTVEVEVDTTPRAMEQREADREQRMDHRADRLETRAARHAADGNRRMDEARAFFQLIPFGQPVVDNTDRRRRQKQGAKWDKGLDLVNYAYRVEDRADTTRRHMHRRYAPQTVRRRIDRLVTDERRIQLYLDEGEWAPTFTAEGKPTSHRRPIDDPTRRRRLSDQLADTRDQLRWWREVLQQQIDAGETHPTFGPDDVTVGQWVRVRGWWREVTKVNRKTVTVNAFPSAVDNGWVPGKVTFTEIQKVADQPPGTTERDHTPIQD